VPAEIVLRAAVIAVEIVVAAGVLGAVVDVVAGAVDVPEAAVEVVDATAAVAEDGTNFCHGSSRIRRINQEGFNEKDRRDCGPFSLLRGDVI